MNDIELTTLFVELARLKERQVEVEKFIEMEVLRRAESVKIAGIEAKFYKPSYGTPDYEACAVAFGVSDPETFDEALRNNSTTKVTTSWKGVCEELKLTPPPGELKPARVVIK